MNMFDNAYMIICKGVKGAVSGLKDFGSLFLKHYSFIIILILIILFPIWAVPYTTIRFLRRRNMFERDKILYRVLDKDNNDVSENKKWFFGLDGSVFFWCDESKSLELVKGFVVKKIRRKKVSEDIRLCNTCGSVISNNVLVCDTCGQVFSWEE